MPRIIIQCPRGKLALWSTIVDDWVTEEIEPTQMVEHLLAEERTLIQERVERAVARNESNTYSYAECMNESRKTQRREARQS